MGRDRRALSRRGRHHRAGLPRAFRDPQRHELRLGDNIRGFLTVTALAELSSIVERMGGNPAAPLHLAGLGDLITTATSAGSHHHELGRKLARGETKDISGEGIHTLAMVEKYRLFDISPYPLYGLVHDAMNKPVNIAQKFHEYLDHIGQ